MPRNVTIVLPNRRLTPSDIATALTVARALAASGRHVEFHHGYDGVQEPVNTGEQRRWVRGVVVIGTLDEAASIIEAPFATVAGPVPAFGTLAAVRVAGAPALLVSDASAVRAGRLLASPSLAATRGVPAASVGETAPPELPKDRVTFDQLGVAPAQADVFGRADLTAAIDTRRLPAGTRAARAAARSHGRARRRGREGGGERLCQRTSARQRRRGERRADASRSRVAGRPRRHQRQRPRRGAAPQRAGRLPVRAAGLSGANPGLEQRRAGARRSSCRRFRRSRPALGRRRRGAVAGDRRRTADADARPRRRRPQRACARERADHRQAQRARRRAACRRLPSSPSATRRPKARRRTFASTAAASRSPTAPAEHCSTSAAS